MHAPGAVSASLLFRMVLLAAPSGWIGHGSTGRVSTGWRNQPARRCLYCPAQGQRQLARPERCSL